MSKKTNSINVEPASNDALNELEQLRLIVFGQAKLELEDKIESLHKQLNTDIDNLHQQFKSEMTNLSELMQNNVATLQASIAELDTKVDEHQGFSEQENAKLLSQLEMAENAGKDDADSLNKRIDDEVSKIENSLDASIQEIVTQLERVTQELSSSKTDRKTLAKLLSNMASNLDADN